MFDYRFRHLASQNKCNYLKICVFQNKEPCFPKIARMSIRGLKVTSLDLANHSHTSVVLKAMSVIRVDLQHPLLHLLHQAEFHDRYICKSFVVVLLTIIFTRATFKLYYLTRSFTFAIKSIILCPAFFD